MYSPTVTGSRSLSMSDYLVGLESSGWLRHIKAIVDAAVFLTKVIIYMFFFVCLKLQCKCIQGIIHFHCMYCNQCISITMFTFLNWKCQWLTLSSRPLLLSVPEFPLSLFPLSGGDRGRSKCLGSLFRWMGPNSSSLLSGVVAHGSVLSYHQGFHGIE